MFKFGRKKTPNVSPSPPPPPPPRQATPLDDDLRPPPLYARFARGSSTVDLSPGMHPAALAAMKSSENLNGSRPISRVYAYDNDSVTRFGSSVGMEPNIKPPKRDSAASSNDGSSTPNKPKTPRSRSNLGPESRPSISGPAPLVSGRSASTTSSKPPVHSRRPSTSSNNDYDQPPPPTTTSVFTRIRRISLTKRSAPEPIPHGAHPPSAMNAGTSFTRVSVDVTPSNAEVISKEASAPPPTNSRMSRQASGFSSSSRNQEVSKTKAKDLPLPPPPPAKEEPKAIPTNKPAAVSRVPVPVASVAPSTPVAISRQPSSNQVIPSSSNVPQPSLPNRNSIIQPDTAKPEPSRKPTLPSTPQRSFPSVEPDTTKMEPPRKPSLPITPQRSFPSSEVDTTKAESSRKATLPSTPQRSFPSMEQPTEPDTPKNVPSQKRPLPNTPPVSLPTPVSAAAKALRRRSAEFGTYDINAARREREKLLNGEGSTTSLSVQVETPPSEPTPPIQAPSIPTPPVSVPPKEETKTTRDTSPNSDGSEKERMREIRRKEKEKRRAAAEAESEARFANAAAAQKRSKWDDEPEEAPTPRAAAQDLAPKVPVATSKPIRIISRSKGSEIIYNPPAPQGRDFSELEEAALAVAAPRPSPQVRKPLPPISNSVRNSSVIPPPPIEKDVVKTSSPQPSPPLPSEPSSSQDTTTNQIPTAVNQTPVTTVDGLLNGLSPSSSISASSSLLPTVSRISSTSSRQSAEPSSDIDTHGGAKIPEEEVLDADDSMNGTPTRDDVPETTSGTTSSNNMDNEVELNITSQDQDHVSDPTTPVESQPAPQPVDLEEPAMVRFDQPQALTQSYQPRGTPGHSPSNSFSHVSGGGGSRSSSPLVLSTAKATIPRPLASPVRSSHIPSPSVSPISEKRVSRALPTPPGHGASGSISSLPNAAGSRRLSNIDQPHPNGSVSQMSIHNGSIRSSTHARTSSIQSSRYSRSPPIYPLLSHLLYAPLLTPLLKYFSFRELLPLLSLSKLAKKSMEETRDVKELILERYLSDSIGYERWSPERMGRKGEPLSLTLRDLNSYMRGISVPPHHYGSVAEAFLTSLAATTVPAPDGTKSTVPKSLTNQVRMMASSTRAYSKVVVRLRAQADAVAAHCPPPPIPSSSSQINVAVNGNDRGRIPRGKDKMPVTGPGTHPPTKTPGYNPMKRSASPAFSFASSTAVGGNGNYPYNNRFGSEVSLVSSAGRSQMSGINQYGVSTTPGKFKSPLYRAGHAPLLRVFVPSPDGAWLNDSSVMECERELKRAGVLSSLKVGDIIWDIAAGEEANTGRMVWDGNYLIDLDYSYSIAGDVPRYLDSLAFSPSYWHKIIRTNGNPIVHIDLSPFAVEISNNLQLLQDRVQTETPQGGHHTVLRWIHRARVRIRPGMPVNPFVAPVTLNDGTRQPAMIDSGWFGTLVIEAEGTNEGLADLQARCGDAVMLFPAKTLLKGDGGGGRPPQNGRGMGRSVFRLLRGQSRPGEIWLRCVREKERIG